MEFYSPGSGFLVGIWVFSPEFGFFSNWFGFWGIEIETDSLESVFGGEDLPSTAGIVGLAGFELVPVGSFRWVGSRMGLDRPRYDD